MAYTMAAPSDLEYVFPSELDEFLEICIEEYGENWEAISFAFMDIAEGLDPTLAERANSFFSPATLQQRWLELTGNISHSNEAVPLPAGEAWDGPVSVAAVDAGDSGCIVADMDMKFHGEPATFLPPRRCKSQGLEEHYAALRAKLPTTLDSEEVSEDLAQVGDNSSDEEDFSQARRSIKLASGSLVTSQAPLGSSRRRKDIVVLSPQGRQSIAWKGPARFVNGAIQADARQMAASKPVELTMHEPGYEAEDLKNDDIPDVNNDDDFGCDDPKRASIRAMRRLLRCAPNGECTWGVWLEATREWPRLQTAVGSPEFCQQDANLKVRFDVGKTHQVLQSEQEAYEEFRQEQAARMQKSPAEFIREAERRREMVGKALGGLFLTSRNPDLERMYAGSQLAKI
mmetsp:Transcript_49231/g.86645  ORF Transcript_49231/g.86645 Transcript_49231/m.86645 type:complete len:400 (-) Transcript_49231:243-1442(-)